MIYQVHATNSQGAYDFVGQFTSVNSAVKYVRQNYGKGWKIQITQEDKVIKEFTLRGK